MMVIKHMTVPKKQNAHAGKAEALHGVGVRAAHAHVSPQAVHRDEEDLVYRRPRAGQQALQAVRTLVIQGLQPWKLGRSDAESFLRKAAQPSCPGPRMNAVALCSCGTTPSQVGNHTEELAFDENVAAAAD